MWLWCWQRRQAAAPVPLYFSGENQSAPPPCSGFFCPFVHKLLLASSGPDLSTESLVLWIKLKCVCPVCFKILKCNPGE